MQNVQVVDTEALRREEILDEMERTKWKRIGYELKKDWRLYLLLVPLLVFPSSTSITLSFASALLIV